MSNFHIGDDIGDQTVIDCKNAIQQAGPNGPITLTFNNTNGGKIFDGLLVYNMLHEHKGVITTINEGICAGIAAIVFLAGEYRKASNPDAKFMFCRSRISAFGTAKEIRELADELNQIDEQLAIICDRHLFSDKVSTPLPTEHDQWFTVTEAELINIITKGH